MKIREAVETDSAAIRRLLRACDLPDDIVEAPGSHYFIAEEDGDTLGTIGLESYPPAGLLRSASVLPEHRGRRIGDALVREVLRKAGSIGLDEIVLLTTTAEKYFARFGFRRAERNSVTGAIGNSEQFRGSQCAGAVVMRMNPGLKERNTRSDPDGVLPPGRPETKTA